MVGSMGEAWRGFIHGWWMEGNPDGWELDETHGDIPSEFHGWGMERNL